MVALTATIFDVGTQRVVLISIATKASIPRKNKKTPKKFCRMKDNMYFCRRNEIKTLKNKQYDKNSKLLVVAVLKIKIIVRR